MDYHQHYCVACRAAWEHDGDAIYGQAARDASHTCPRCRRRRAYYRYKGYESPEEVAALEALIELENDDRVPQHVQRQAAADFRALAERLWREKGQPKGIDRYGRVVV